LLQAPEATGHAPDEMLQMYGIEKQLHHKPIREAKAATYKNLKYGGGECYHLYCRKIFGSDGGEHGWWFRLKKPIWF